MIRTTLAMLLLAAAASAGDITIRNNGGAFQVVGWIAPIEPAGGWESIFTVSAGSASGLPPLLGSYSVESGMLTFHPRWPVSVAVKAAFHPSGIPTVEAFFAPATSKGAALSTSVAHVYPSTDELPENALRLYVYFSAAMSRGEAWPHIRLLDEAGNRVELPFLEIDQELWDPGNTRLTVLFDPGRIKRGLVPLRDSGPNLMEGRHYTLVIDREWKDAAGQSLVSEFRKPFQVVAPVRTAIDRTQWKLVPPVAGTHDPLLVVFERPLDYALALRLVTVEGVTGVATLERNETEWRFTPATAWKAGDYRLAVDTSLEDVAGNRIDRPFDVDTFTEVTKEIATQSVWLPFRIAGK